jgi:hypothetical protein
VIKLGVEVEKNGKTYSKQKPRKLNISYFWRDVITQKKKSQTYGGNNIAEEFDMFITKECWHAICL